MQVVHNDDDLAKAYKTCSARAKAYFGDGGNIFSRFRFTGAAKITPQITAGFTYEFGINNNAIGSMNQGNGGDDLGECTNSRLRDSTLWLRHSQLGMVKIGQGSTATDNLILIDLGNRSSAATADTALYNGGFVLRNAAGQFLPLVGATAGTWAAAIRGHESFDTSRRNHVLYETPTLAGFTVQAAVAEDNYWDVALRYAGEFAGFRLAFGVGYQQDTELNAPAGGIAIGAVTVVCGIACDSRSSEIKGSASLLHVATGLFVTGAGGNRELDGGAIPYVGPDITWWYVSGGISKNFFSSGLNGAWADTQVTQWGVGVTQHIDAAAMELFLSYKNTQFDGLYQGAQQNSDFQSVIAGTRINF